MSQKMTKEKSDAGFCIFRSLFSSHVRLTLELQSSMACPGFVSFIQLLDGTERSCSLLGLPLEIGASPG